MPKNGRGGGQLAVFLSALLQIGLQVRQSAEQNVPTSAMVHRSVNLSSRHVSTGLACRRF